MYDDPRQEGRGVTTSWFSLDVQEKYDSVYKSEIRERDVGNCDKRKYMESDGYDDMCVKCYGAEWRNIGM